MDRLTTTEAAKVLNCKRGEALTLLKAVRCRFDRIGRRGPYLWTRADIERVKTVIARKPAGEEREAE